MKLMKNKTVTFLILISLCLLTLFSTIGPNYVLANSSVPIIEETDVLEDLEDMSIDGKPFSLEEYSYNEKKETQILSFMEYCYSPFADKQEDYSLYVYIYNPRNLKFDLNSASNNIEFSITGKADKDYNKYNLILIDVCNRPNYENLFFKFKVKLSEAQKEYFLKTLNSETRVYNVSSFELLEKDKSNAHDYKNALTYKYSGYAKGCGANENAESTLTVVSDYLTTMKLDVYDTVYRPDGHNSESVFTQDSLHSVYFAVSNDYDVYGAINAIHARWLVAKLAPGLVTANKEAFNAIEPFVGKEISTDDNLDYIYCGNFRKYGDLDSTEFFWDWSFNAHGEKNINPLYLLFDASNSSSIDKYVLDSEKIRTKLLESKDIYDGELVLDKYARCMFSSVDSEFTDKNISFDYEYNLKSFKVGDSFWKKLWNLEEDYSSEFSNIQAIYAVQPNDLIGDEEEIAFKLKIGLHDVDNFIKFYEANKNNNTIYLFRYRESSYFSQAATSFSSSDFWALVGGLLGWNNTVNLDAYFFQEEIDLEFDIIDITFVKDNVKTVIPVIMDPMDIIPDATPPLNNNGCQKNRLLTTLFSIILVFVLFWILSAFGGFKLIGNVLVFVVTAPFKFVKWIIGLFKGGGKK